MNGAKGWWNEIPLPPRGSYTRYHANVEECTMYVGETGRTLKQRITEHKRAVRNADSNNGLAVHVAESEHEIRWNEAEVVCREEQWIKRKIKEGLSIKAHTGNLNLDNGAFIDANWTPPP